MSTKAGELLEIMAIRPGMQEDGVTTPSPSVKRATKALVKNLTPLNPEEEITIVSGSGIETKYVRASTGEVLAEKKEDDTEP